MYVNDRQYILIKLNFFPISKLNQLSEQLKIDIITYSNHITRISNIQSIRVTALFNFYWMNIKYNLIKFMNVEFHKKITFFYIVLVLIQYNCKLILTPYIRFFMI